MTKQTLTLVQDRSGEGNCSCPSRDVQVRGCSRSLREIAAEVSLYSAEDAGRIIEVARCLELSL